ncbi:unnamed protein product [Rangifer tarandus platyrhynchus]|uniref:Uncharacterized protein n=1 Tax=Rangifer tarandus platyrhynchus TaxID=3082113 RepID=A0AC59YG39_RANTA
MMLPEVGDPETTTHPQEVGERLGAGSPHRLGRNQPSGRLTSRTVRQWIPDVSVTPSTMLPPGALGNRSNGRAVPSYPWLCPPSESRYPTEHVPHGGTPGSSVQPHVLPDPQHGLPFLSTSRTGRTAPCPRSLKMLPWALPGDLAGDANRRRACWLVIHVTFLGPSFLIFKIRGLRQQSWWRRSWDQGGSDTGLVLKGFPFISQTSTAGREAGSPLWSLEQMMYTATLTQDRDLPGPQKVGTVRGTSQPARLQPSPSSICLIRCQVTTWRIFMQQEGLNQICGGSAVETEVQRRLKATSG